MNEYTKGEWKIIQTPAERKLPQRPDMRYITIGTGNKLVLDERCACYAIARVGPTGKWPKTVAMREANARLIAAAPKLLEACKLARSCMAGYEELQQWAGRLEAAIAEAEKGVSRVG